MKQILFATLVMGLATSAFGAVIEWDAGGDGLSTFAEANWVVTDNTGQPTWTVGADPPAGTVDGAVDVPADAIVGSNYTAGGGAGAGNHYDLADGLSLTVEDSATFRMRTSFSPTRGIRGVPGGAAETLTVSDSAEVIAQFLTDLAVSMSGASQLTLNGGGNPVNATSIDLASNWTGSINFLNEVPADALAEHLSKITVGGAAAVDGVNVQVVSDGSTGSTLTVIPEPASLALLGLGGLVMLRRKQ